MITKIRQHTAYRLPNRTRKVRVVSGRAWLTFAGQDIILRTGETAALDQRDYGVVTSLGKRTLTLEVLDTASPENGASNPEQANADALKTATQEQRAILRRQMYERIVQHQALIEVEEDLNRW